MDNAFTNPRPDVPPPTPSDEEIVDPTTPLGNTPVVTITRHPFGLLVFYVQIVFGLGLSVGLLFFLVPTVVSEENRAMALNGVTLFAIVAGILLIIFLGIATVLYGLNRWLITDDNITQVLQKGLFNRYTSELSMANIEDVSSERNGLFASIFNFGTLKVQTAGEQADFSFIYCPEPDKYAKVILDARERFINAGPEAAERANPRLNLPKS